MENKEEKDNMKDMKDNMYLDQNNFLIIGKKGSAKTTIAWAFAKKISDISGRKIYTLRHPCKELFSKLPFEVQNIDKISSLANLNKAVIIVDEAQDIFPPEEKKLSKKLKTILACSRQNDICFIFICHNSYFVNRSLSSFIDIKIIKETNDKHWENERSYMKKLYEDIDVTGKDKFFIDSDYIRGNNSFLLPKWWIPELSTAYGAKITQGDFFEEENPIFIQESCESAPKCAKVRQSAPNDEKVRQSDEKCANSAPNSAPNMRNVSDYTTLEIDTRKMIKEAKEQDIKEVKEIT